MREHQPKNTGIPSCSSPDILDLEFDLFHSQIVSKLWGSTLRMSRNRSQEAGWDGGLSSSRSLHI